MLISFQPFHCCLSHCSLQHDGISGGVYQKNYLFWKMEKNRIFWRSGRWLELDFIWWLLKLLDVFGRCLSTKTTKTYAYHIYIPFHATYIMHYVSLIIFSWFLFKFEFDIDAMIQNKLFANQFKSLRRLELDAYNSACIAVYMATLNDGSEFALIYQWQHYNDISKMSQLDLVNSKWSKTNDKIKYKIMWNLELLNEN